VHPGGHFLPSAFLQQGLSQPGGHFLPWAFMGQSLHLPSQAFLHFLSQVHLQQGLSHLQCEQLQAILHLPWPPFAMCGQRVFETQPTVPAVPTENATRQARPTASLTSDPIKPFFINSLLFKSRSVLVPTWQIGRVGIDTSDYATAPQRVHHPKQADHSAHPGTIERPPRGEYLTDWRAGQRGRSCGFEKGFSHQQGRDFRTSQGLAFLTLDVSTPARRDLAGSTFRRFAPSFTIR
jgi:hypothetical protein